MLKHKEGGGVVHLIPGGGGCVGEEEGLEGLVVQSGGGGGGRDREERKHFFRAVGVPFFDEGEERCPLLDVLGWVHGMDSLMVVIPLFPFPRTAEEVDDLTAEVHDPVGVHVECADAGF